MSENVKRNILIVHNYYQIPGGEDMVVKNEKEMLEEHGDKVFCYNRNNSELKNMNIFKKIILPFNIIFNIKTYLEIKRIILEKQINIVHVHNTLSLISPSVYYAALACNIPIVQTVHNFRLLCPGATFYRDGHICEDCVSKGLICAIKHNCYRNSKLQTLACVISNKFHRLTGIYKKINYICLTEFNKQKLLQLKQIKSNQVYVKPNFVNRITEFIIPNNRNNQFIFAGRLDKLKGIDILFKAWNSMGRKAPKLIVCGVGLMEKWCHKFIIDNKITNIEMLGFVKNAEVKRLIACSKAFILPTQWYEGFPMGIVEAYSVGTPVICSDLGNAGDIVVENVTGYKFSDIDKLIEVVNKIENDVTIYQSTLIHFLNNYTKDINLRIMLEIYKEASK